MLKSRWIEWLSKLVKAKPTPENPPKWDFYRVFHKGSMESGDVMVALLIIVGALAAFGVGR